MKNLALRVFVSVFVISGLSTAYGACYRLSSSGEAFSRAMYQDSFCIDGEDDTATLSFKTGDENTRARGTYMTLFTKNIKKDGSTTTYSAGLSQGSLFPSFRVKVEGRGGVSKVSMNDTFLFYIDK